MEQLRKFSKNIIITRVFDWQNFLNLEIYRESYVCDYYSIGFENFGGKMSNFKFILRKINIPILI